MEKYDLLEFSTDFIQNTPTNYVSEEAALSPALSGLRIFDAPLVGTALACDALFSEYKKPSIIGPHFKLPGEWLANAKTVISYFHPYSLAVQKGNARDFSWPSKEWLHARYEGQLAIDAHMRAIKKLLEEKGYRAIIPKEDPLFKSVGTFKKDSQLPGLSYTSNWSERHAAYVCGLGTFSLSKGMITEKGIAGRFGSLITDMEIAPTTRSYTGIYDYCILCGKCVKNCPAGAITLENGKDHVLCDLFLKPTLEQNAPRYGCGKCQVAVPCASRNPSRK